MPEQEITAEQTDRQLSKTLEIGQSIKVGVLLFPEVEVLDFAGPFEVFCVASRVAKRDLGRSIPAFEVTTIAARKEAVTARHGLRVLPDYEFSDAPDYDILIVPGGVVTQPLNDRETLDYLHKASAHAALNASVCTGAFILAKLGLIIGKRATTHWEDIAELKAAFPMVDVVEDVAFVDEGAIITSAGISAGIGMSLYIVQRILGHAIARNTARQMQYDWQPVTLS